MNMQKRAEGIWKMQIAKSSSMRNAANPKPSVFTQFHMQGNSSGIQVVRGTQDQVTVRIQMRLTVLIANCGWLVNRRKQERRMKNALNATTK